VLSANSSIRGERDSYELVRKLSEGGMGVVWEAVSNAGKRKVVVKGPLLDGHNDRIKIERLLMEAAVLRAINDELAEQAEDVNQRIIRSHVVRYVDQLTDPIHPILVLEHVDGTSMSIAHRGKPAGEELAIRYGLDLVRIVKALHSKGVIHRDISPDNLILNPMRGMVLIDFGTSVMQTSARHSQHRERIVFKRGYSAPELMRGVPDTKSDVFSAGATMFYFLTGRNPADFVSDSKQEYQFCPKDVNSDISASLSEIVRIATTGDSGKRFESAAAMLAALETTRERKAKPIQSAPRIILGGNLIELRGDCVEIGRAHTCDAECKSSGHKIPLQIPIRDNSRFVEKHHVRITIGTSRDCWIEDLQTTNRTATKSSAAPTFEVLTPLTKRRLLDGDTVALVYSPTRGPYITFVFKNA
jgi:serine/threonine protein kinase